MNVTTAPTLGTHNTVIIPVIENDDYQNVIDKIAQLSGVNSEAISNDFKAKAKENLTLFVTGKSFQKIVLLGLGKTPKTSAVIAAFRSFFYKNKKKLSGNITINLSIGNTENLAEYASNGIFLAPYEIGFLKTDDKKETDFYSGNSDLTFIAESAVSEAVAKGKATAESQCGIMQLMDSPANHKTPQQLGEYVIKSSKTNGFKATVYDTQQCEEMGLHALLAVGRGSIDNPPVFIVMEYNGVLDIARTDNRKQTFGLVGKGVTFDTGGVSLKPGENMNYMKSDMGGAGAVIGTIELLAKLKAPVHVIGIVPATENCIDGKAIKPGDVINSYAGKTIEVINTDAEGRLILADGLHYMKKNFNPDVMIDLATLTGSAIRALGFGTAAMMSNNDALVEKLYKAATQTDEKVWRMPLWDDDYKDMMKSDVADIMNLSVAPVAGAITAAKFLEFFIDEHPNWAHLDIAGVAFGSSEYGSMKSGTAYGVRLLTEFILSEG